MKKIFLLFSLFFLMFSTFAQGIDDEEVLSKSDKKIDFLVQLEPGISINTASTTVSAPSPLIFPVSLGFLWPNDSFLAFQPYLSFFTMTHLYYDNKALPAEIENRTSDSFFLMFTLPLVIALNTENFRIQLMPGVSVLSHFCTLANNVQPQDSGYTGSAEGDVKAINEYLWSNGRFFYISTGASLLWSFNTIKAGPVFNMYIPAGSIFSSEGLQGMIISLGLKVTF